MTAAQSDNDRASRSTGTLLLVDDRQIQLEGVTQALKRWLPQWRVHTTEGFDDTIQLLRKLGSKVPDVVSVDLGLGPDPDGPSVGLQLLMRLKELGGLRLAVHSAQQVRPEVVQQLAGLPASYIKIHDTATGEMFAHAVPLIAQGCLVFSPSVAARIPEAVVATPDVLDDIQWRMLNLLAREPRLSYDLIAELEDVSVGAINLRISRMLSDLAQGGVSLHVDHSDPHRNRRALVEYYILNRIRHKRA